MKLRKINYLGYEVEVSDDGKLVIVNGNERKQTLVKPQRANKGFYQITLGKNKKEYVHRLVAAAWLKDYDDDAIVSHINMNTTDNHYRNLTHRTHSEVIHEAIKRGKMRLREAEFIKNEDQYVNVVTRLIKGDSLKSIAKDYNTSDMSVHRFKKRYNIKPIKRK